MTVANFKFAQTQAFQLAGSGASITDTSLVLQNFAQINGTLLTMTDFGLIGYGTIEPDNAQEEQISFSGVTQNVNGTATLTGVKTVMMVAPYTETPGLATTHAGGTKFVITNTSGFYNKLVSKDDDATITGKYTFTSTQMPKLDTYAAPVNNEDLATKKYVDDTASFGAPNATTTVDGIVQLATASDLTASTEIGTTGGHLVPSGSLFKPTSAGAADAGKVPVLDATGKLAAAFGGTASSLATLNASTKVVENPASASVTAALNSIPLTNGISIKIDKSWLEYVTNLWGSAADGNVTIAAGTTTLTGDMNYGDLTVLNGGILDCAGYKIYCAGTLTVNTGGRIIRNGHDATDSVNGDLGIPGAALATHSVYGGLAGATGGAHPGSGTNDGNAGGGGTNRNPSTNKINGVAGGAGGNSPSKTGGAAGAAGTATPENLNVTSTSSTFPVTLTLDTTTAISFFDIAIVGATSAGVYATAASSSAGGSGAQDSGAYPTNGSGAGGCSGGNAGAIYIAARQIINNGTIEAIGGKGGKGGDAYGGVNAGGGGGGGGGIGGLIILATYTYTGSGSILVTGGAKGAKGLKDGTGNDGADGTLGNDGKYVIITF